MRHVTHRAGKNVWGRVDALGDVVEYVTAPSMPDGDGWFAHYPTNRVKGDTYEYYNGQTDWELKANRAMASQANSNFRRQQS